MKNNWHKTRRKLVDLGYTECAVDKAIEDYMLSNNCDNCRQKIQEASHYRSLNNPSWDQISFESKRSGCLKWKYCGKSYEMNAVKFDKLIISASRNMFCLEIRSIDTFIFYDAYGKIIFTYIYGEDVEFPNALGYIGAQFLFRDRKNKLCWWVYKGHRFWLKLTNEEMATICGIDGQFILISNNNTNRYFSPYGTLECERQNKRELYIHSKYITFEYEIRLLDYLAKYNLFVTGIGNEVVEDLHLYDVLGQYHSTITLPSNMYAVYCISRAVGSDNIRICYYAEKPRELPNYSLNNVSVACYNYTKVRLEWFDLKFLNNKPILVVNPYAMDEYYYGYYRS